MNINITSGPALLRLLLGLGDMRGAYTVQRGQTTLVVWQRTFEIGAGIIETLISEKWLIPHARPGCFEFNLDREYEWDEKEQVLQTKSRALLVDRYPDEIFPESGHWNTLLHPHSSNHDMNGLLFKSKHGHEYLVCEGGGILPIPAVVVVG
jgi:hypothetical protein